MTAVDEQWLHDDDELLAELGEAVRDARQVPERFVQAGKAAFTWRQVDGELAELVLDSAMDDAPAVRAPANGVRVLSFESETISVDVEVTEVGGRVSLRGLAPDAVGDVVAQTVEERRTVTIDQNGWFTFTDLPRGTTRLVLQSGSGAAVTTAWISL